MITVLLVIHLLICIAMVGLILLQKSEGGALGIGGGNAMGGLVSSRGAGNLLTRGTTLLAAAFFATSMILALMASHREDRPLLEDSPLTAPAAAPNQATPQAEGTEADAMPSVPAAGDTAGEDGSGSDAQDSSPSVPLAR